MSKPLNLTIFECYECGDTSCFVIEKDKRLTEAELAAEYWAAALDADLMAPRELVEKTATMRRFATLPHYDEAAA